MEKVFKDIVDYDNKTNHVNFWNFQRNYNMDVLYKINKSNPKKIAERKQSKHYQNHISKIENGCGW